MFLVDGIFSFSWKGIYQGEKVLFGAQKNHRRMSHWRIWKLPFRCKMQRIIFRRNRAKFFERGSLFAAIRPHPVFLLGGSQRIDSIRNINRWWACSIPLRIGSSKKPKENLVIARQSQWPWAIAI